MTKINVFLMVDYIKLLLLQIKKKTYDYVP